MKRLYIYLIVAGIVIVSMSIIKGTNVEEGFQLAAIGSKLKSWFGSEYFIIPILMTIVVGPMVYAIYKYVLRRVNKAVTKISANANAAPAENA